MHASDLIQVEPHNFLMFFDIQLIGNLNANNCPSSINLFKVKDGLAVHDFSCPGLSDDAVADIAMCDNKYFWIPQRVKKMFQCSKFPGKCVMTFKTQQNCKAHEEICEIDTSISTKMV